MAHLRPEDAAMPGDGSPGSPSGSARGERGNNNAPELEKYVPVRPIFCMGAFPECVQELNVRGDMLRSQTIIDILHQKKLIQGNKRLKAELTREKSSSLQPDEEGEPDEEDVEPKPTDPKFAKREAMIQNALRHELKKELGKDVVFTRVPPTDNRLQKKLKVAGTELTIAVAVVKDEPADCFKVEVKRVLVSFPDLVRLRLKEELNLESLESSTSRQEHKPKKGSLKPPERKQVEHAEICVEKWRDEWNAVEATLKFEKYKRPASQGGKEAIEEMYPRLQSIEVRFDIPHDFNRYHGRPSLTRSESWTPPYQAGEKHSAVVHFWKERLLSEMAAHYSGDPMKKEWKKAKMHELDKSAAAELVVHSLLQAIEEKGSFLMRKWRAENGIGIPPEMRYSDPGDVLRLHAPHTDSEEPPSNHTNNYNMASHQYHFIQMYVDRPVDERDATQVWDMVMQSESRHGHKTEDMRDEVRKKLKSFKRFESPAREPAAPGKPLPPDPYVKLLLNQRRRLKRHGPDGRVIHEEGTLLYFAMTANVPHQVLDELLEQGADPEALQSVHPFGTHRAVLRAPVLYFAQNVEQVQTLIENEADTESKSCLNFFTHTTTLWACCFNKKESVLDQLLNYNADPNTRGFHPDHPPLSGQEMRVTALEMAASMGMRQRASELLGRKAVFKVDLATTFSTAPPDVVRQMALVGAVERPKELLREDIVTSTHPSVLQTVYSEVAKDSDAVDKLRKQVKYMGSEHLVKFLQYLIREAPLAAGTFLDGVLLQTPDVLEQSRNPLPQTAAIQEDDQMNVAYEHSKTWDFEYEVAGSMMPWQSDLIYQGRSSSSKKAGASGSSCCNNARFTDVKVLDVQGIIRHEIFLEMEMLSWEQRVDLFLQCTSLQAIVIFTWRRWARTVHIVDVAGLVGRCVVILLWWAIRTVQDSSGALGANLTYTVIVCCWSIFTGTVIGGLVLEIPVLVSRLGDMEQRRASSSGRWDHLNSFLKRCIRLLLNLSLSISGWNAWDDTPMGQWSVGGQPQYRNFMALVLYISYVYLMMDLSSFHGLGEQLLPIVNAFSRTAMKTMLSIIFMSWVSFLLWSAIEFHGEGADGEAVNMWQLLVESFLSVWVELGESTFFPGAYNDPRFAYCHIVGGITFIAVNIIMMNIFINICGECYAEEKSRVNGSLLTSKLRACLETIAQRRLLLGKFSDRFDIAATTVIQRTAAACAALFATLLIVCIATGAWTVVPIVLAVTVATLFTLLKLFVILSHTKKKPAHVEPGQKWWIDRNYIWVCTPKDCDQVDDRQDESQDHSRLFVVYSGDDLSETDIDGEKRIIDINGMYKQDSQSGQRNGRPQYFRFTPRQHDDVDDVDDDDDVNLNAARERKRRDVPDIRIYWKEEFSGSGDLGQWELTVRDPYIDKYKKPTVFFYLKGCTSPFGHGLKQWEVVDKDDFKGDLFVMTSQDFSAYQHLYAPGSNGSLDKPTSRLNSARRSTKASQRDSKGDAARLGALTPIASPGRADPAEHAAAPQANIAVMEQALEAGDRERPGELEAPPEWLRRLLAKAQLDVDSIDSAADATAFLTRASEWVRREMVTESQLCEDDDALEELMNEMNLGKYPRKRLRQALARPPAAAGAPPGTAQAPLPPLGGGAGHGGTRYIGAASGTAFNTQAPGPLDKVPPQVRRRIEELGLQDSDIENVAKLKTVLTQLGMSPEEGDVQAIFDEATEEASGTLRLSGLLAYLYREEPAQEPAQRPDRVPPVELD